MHTSLVTILLAATTSSAPGDFDSDIDALQQLPDEIVELPMLQHLAEILPVVDLLFGGGILIIIILIHATGLRWVGDLVTRRVDAVLRHPTLWHADLLMSSIVFQLLALHLFEVLIWSFALELSGLIPNWRQAGFFAGNTYTTIGYGAFLLPPKWEMVAPIMAISGLFTFGWSGSVLVDYVQRIHKIRDAVHARKNPGVTPPQETQL
jgi:hypothetical protein